MISKSRINLLFVLTIFSVSGLVFAGCTVNPEKYEPLKNCAVEPVLDHDVHRGTSLKCMGKPEDDPLTAIPEKLPTDLVYLRLYKQEIHTIHRTDFSNCHQLLTLDLCKNNLTRIAADAFSDLAALTELALNVNNLDFSDHDSFPLGLISNLPTLQTLWLDMNSWGTLKDYRLDMFSNKPILNLLSMDAIPGAVFPALSREHAPESLRHLRIYQGIQVWDKDTFKNWSSLQLQSLTIHSLGKDDKKALSEIKPGACATFLSIESLDLSYNRKLNFSKPLNTCLSDLPLTNVTSLNLNRIVPNQTTNPIPAPREFFERLENIHTLTKLSLDWNGLISLNVPGYESIQKYIGSIRHLSLAYNRLFGNNRGIIDHFWDLRDLEYVDLSHQTRLYIPSMPKEYHGAADLSMKLRPTGDELHNITLVFPPSLRYMNFSDTFGAADFNVEMITLIGASLDIAHVDISKNRISRLTGPVYTAYNNSNITIRLLNLSDCGLVNLGHTFFTKKVRIHSLDLSKNMELGAQLSQDRDGCLMEYMNEAGVKHLNLSLTNIMYIPRLFFSKIHSLETLTIQNAGFGNWYGNLGTMQQLNFLDLSNNSFMYLLPNTVNELETIANVRNFTIDLSGNPLYIQCSNLYFLKWMRSLIISDSNITLANAAGIMFLRRSAVNYSFYTMQDVQSIVKNLEIECHGEVLVLVAGIGCGLMMLLVCISAIMHRQRWDIHRILLRMCQKRTSYQKLRCDYPFDAFVIFHNEDIGWVKHQLIPRLELHPPHPLKLCIHERDWIPGYTIEDNICSSVQDSRKTLVLLSRNCLRSSWCEFEMQIAKMRSINEAEDLIVVVSLERIPIKEMSSTYINLRRTSTWLEWRSGMSETEEDRFWSRLINEVGIELSE